MQPHYKLLIGGKWVDTREVLEVRNPFDNSVVSVVAKAGKKELQQAVETAGKSFDKVRMLSSLKRSQILGNVSRITSEKKEQFARTISLEAGKTIRNARGEVDRAINTFSIAAEEAKRIGGEVIPLDTLHTTENVTGMTRRFPIGAIIGITPFNFPLNLVAHKLAPAIASSNTIVLKPSSTTPITALMLGEVLLEAGIPEGMVNITPCDSELGEDLARDNRFKLLTFTGSSEVGWHLKEISGKKRVMLELGGNAALIIHSDIDNLDYAVSRSIHGSFGYSGQTCISIQRIYLHKNIKDTFLDGLIKETKKLKMGNPLDEATDIGPMIREDAARKVEEWVNEARKGGAKIITGGKRSGSFYEPTILTNVKRDMKVHCQEVFGPVVCIYEYEDFDDAIKCANDSVYGLQAGVFTQDIKRVFDVFERLEVGGVMINEVPTFRVDQMPYGGTKDSGFGREGVKYAIEEMTEMRLLVLNMRR